MITEELHRPSGLTAGPSGAPALTLGLLRPLRICVDGREVVLPQQKLRLLLAALALQDNRLVSTDSLIVAIWDDNPPPTALRALRVYVSQLRKFLAAHRVGAEHCQLITQPPGYRLMLGDGVLDRHDFDRYCGQARTALDRGKLEQAAHWYRQALAVPSGPSLGDVRAESTLLERAALWLDELRLGVLIRCLDLDLRLGRCLDVITEITAQLADRPLHEGLHARLMIALYRSGRTSDALAAYRSLHGMLVEELGAGPGPEVRRVHQAMLASEPTVTLEPVETWTL
jgi:DNA-binding SARP family transcriptional activator